MRHLQVDFMAANSKESHDQRRRLLAAAGRKQVPGAGPDTAMPQDSSSSSNLPSSNTTVRRMPKLSEQCYQLAVLAHPPQTDTELLSDVRAAANAVLDGTLGKLEAATGLQGATRDARGNVTAVTLTGGHHDKSWRVGLSCV